MTSTIHAWQERSNMHMCVCVCVCLCVCVCVCVCVCCCVSVHQRTIHQQPVASQYPYTHDHEGETECHDLSCREATTHSKRDSVNERDNVSIISTAQEETYFQLTMNQLQVFTRRLNILSICTQGRKADTRAVLKTGPRHQT